LSLNLIRFFVSVYRVRMRHCQRTVKFVLGAFFMIVVDVNCDIGVGF